VPFPEGTWPVKIHLPCEAAPRPLRQLRPDVPAGVAAVVARMMAKRPADRFQAMREVAQALAPFCQAPVAVAVPAATVADVPPSAAPVEDGPAAGPTERQAVTVEAPAGTGATMTAHEVPVAIPVPDSPPPVAAV